MLPRRGRRGRWTNSFPPSPTGWTPRGGYRSRRLSARCWRWTGSTEFYCCPTLDRQAIDAGGNRFRETIRASLANFEPFSEDHEFLSTTLIGESEILKYDREGRVILTETIKDHAGIADRVTFVGQGYKFQIWEPERFVAYREEAKNRLRDLRRTLGSGHRATGANPGAGR